MSGWPKVWAMRNQPTVRTFLITTSSLYISVSLPNAKSPSCFLIPTKKLLKGGWTVPKTNNPIPFRVTLSRPHFLVSLIRPYSTVFVCTRISLTLTPSILFASYIFLLSFSVVRILRKVCLFLLSVRLCLSSVTREAKLALADFGMSCAAQRRSPVPFQLPPDKPVLVTIPHPHTGSPAHTAMRDRERETDRERLLKAVAAPGVRRFAPSHLNLYQHEWHIAIIKTELSLVTKQEVGLNSSHFLPWK